MMGSRVSLLLVLLAVVCVECTEGENTVWQSAWKGSDRLLREITDWATLRGKAEKTCLRERGLHGGCSLYFVHNHKAGGTTLCNVAVKSGLRVARPVRNCLEPDDLRGEGKEGELARYVLQNHLQFVAHEFGPFLPLTKVSSQIIYVTVVRNPWDRVMSSAHHELCQRSLPDARAVATKLHCRFDPLTATAADIVLDPCFRRAFSSVSHYVNKFSPCPTSKGVPACSPQNVQEAKHLLELMSAIVVTDTPDTFERSFAVLTAIVPQMKYEKSLRSGTSAHSDAKFLLRNNQTAWNALVDLNTEDYLFYKHALLMADFQYKRLKNTSGHMKGKSNYFPTYKPVDDKPHNLESGEFNSDENRTFCSFDEK